MGAHEHKHAAKGAVRCAVVTISDTRTAENDVGGALLRDKLLAAGHVVVEQRILRDEPDLVRAHVRALAAKGDVRVVVTTGGTGITARDNTYEALAGLLEKELPGFGELFRALSYQAIGPSAMLSRAFAGTYAGLVLIALPGAPDAVRLAMERLVLPELEHLAWLVAPGAAHGHGHAHAHGHLHVHHHGHTTAAPPPESAPPAPAVKASELVRDVRAATAYAADKMKKVGLFASAQMFCDVYGLQPGQAQKPHVHDGNDKIYYVLEGEGRFQLGDEELRATAGCAIHAPAGVSHGVVNDGPAPLALLVYMAPNPTPPGASR